MQPEPKNLADRFIAAVFGAISSLQEAGDIAAQAIESNPNFIDEVCDKCQDITPAFIRKMQLIGLKKLHPRLAISEAPGVRRLARLPFHIQSQYATNPVPLLIRTPGGWEILQADVRTLTPDQAKQVFSDENVRDEAEQRLWLEDQAAQRVAPKTNGDCPYRIVGRTVVVLQPTKFDRSDLIAILGRLEN